MLSVKDNVNFLFCLLCYTGISRHAPSPDAPREWTINGLIATFGTLGYEKCDNSDLEQGFEKIAVYATMSGKLTHAAWQRKDGQWSSKLGDDIDITHSTLNGISGTEYGTAMIFVKRLRQKRRND